MGQSNKSVSEVEETPVENLDVKYNLESNLIESENELYNIRNANYMERQPYIEPSMRAILADWIMEVCFQFRFKRQTYHTSVMLVDIFMSCTSNMPTHLLQLIGVTCLCIASKNEVRIFRSLFIILNYEDNYIGSIHTANGDLQRIHSKRIHNTGDNRM